MTSSTDCIKREIHLKAPLERVWRALTTPREFGEWFGVRLEAERFEAGQPVTGQLTISGYDHLKFQFEIETLEPLRVFAYRWHPYAVDPARDYSQEPTTLVVFTLQEENGGTHLTVEESGFDQIPVERRSEAFRMNSGGWEQQVKNVERYVTSA